MINRLDISDFMLHRNNIPVVDVRSPGEFETGHIPGAVNIPLFDNEERAKVGTLYKKSGKEAAVFLGLEIAGKKLKELVGKARTLAPDKKLLVHCWRGGMRSENMAMLFSTIGIKCSVLKGGYKAYRKFIREQLSNPMNIYILSGMTGSGKTELLYHLKNNGEQIIDLEYIAHHKGSAFGNLGQEDQPSNEQFENQLFEEFRKLNPLKKVWIEDESHNIGKVYVPETFFSQMRTAPCVKVILDKEIRIKRLVKEYGLFPKETLIHSVKKIYRRLGGQHAEVAIKAISEGNLEKAIDIVLVYYDKTYLFGVNKRDKNTVINIKLNHDQHQENSIKIINTINDIENGRL